MIEWFTTLCAEFEGAAHYISNVVVEVDGDEATSQCYVQAWHWLHSTAEAGPNRNADFVTIGTFLDKLRRTENGWRIAERRRRNIGTSAIGLGPTPPALEGLGGSPDVGVRD